MEENNISLQIPFAEEEPLQEVKTTASVKLPCDKQLPPVIRELVSNAPENFKMATFIACVAPLGCLATKRLELSTPDWVFLSKWCSKGIIVRLAKNLFRKKS